MVDSHPLFRDMDRNNVKEVVKSFESKNGNKLKDVSIKELTLMFHKEVVGRCDSIDKKIADHLTWAEKSKSEGYKTLVKFQREHDRIVADHDIAIQHISDNIEKIISDMPEKGFCEKINKTLYDETGKDKVELMWHDRRWIKRILAILVAVGGGNIVVQIIIG